MTTLQQQFERVQPLADAICDAMRGEVRRLGFQAESIALHDPRSAIYRLARDQAADVDSLVGEWRDDQGQRIGMIVFNADGSFFAEHDVVRVHPRDPRVFVEAVNAWGRDSEIRAEPRLMPMVS